MSIDRLRATVRAFVARAMGLSRRETMDARLEEELDFHLAMSTERLRRRGLAAEDARRAAAIAFGPRQRFTDESRDAFRNRVAEETWRDIRYALRLLRRNTGYAAASLLTLALGIGATTSIYSMVAAVVLRPLPYAAPEALTAVWERRQGGNEHNVVSVATYEDWKSRSRSFAALEAVVPQPMTLLAGDRAERLMGARITPGYLRLLGIAPAIGRDFTTQEATGAGARVVMLSSSLWHTRFGGDPAVIGRAISLDGEPYVVIGVMPAAFDPPQYFWLGSQHFWLPFAATEQTHSWGRFLMVMGRLRPGVTVGDAQRELSGFSAARAAVDPTLRGWSATVLPLAEQITGEVRAPMLVVLAAAALLFAMTVVNVANLTLAFTRRRLGELATRRSIGASRGRLVRQLLAQSAVLCGMGTTLGVAVAYAAVPLVRALAPDDLPRVAGLRIDERVLFVTAVAAVAATLVIGVVAALRGVPSTAASLLGGRSERHTPRTSGASLVISEVALGVVLGVVAALMVRSFAELRQVSLGFDARHAVVARVALSGDDSGDHTTPAPFFDELLRRVRASAGVDEAGVTSTRPFGGAGPATGVWDPRRPRASGSDPVTADVRRVDAGYFRSLRVPVLAGSLASFGAGGSPGGAPPRVVVTRALARAVWGDEDVVGRTLHLAMYDDLEARVDAVVGDVHLMDPRTAARPAAYLDVRQFPSPVLDVILRGRGEDAVLVDALRRTLRELDPGIPLYEVWSMPTLVDRSLARDRFTAFLLGLFALVSLCLAFIGIYGVFAGDVVRRRKEIGIRVALGARTFTIAGMVIRRALVLTTAGILVGTALALVLARAMSSFLFGVGASDPASFVVTAFVLALAAVGATTIPALRAARVSPITAIRLD